MSINTNDTYVNVATQAIRNSQSELPALASSITGFAYNTAYLDNLFLNREINSPLRQNLSNLIKVNVNRPEVVSIFDFMPLVKDENSEDALFNLSSDQEFSLDLTSASILLEKQIILRRLSDASLSDYIYSFGGRDYSKLLLNDEFKNTVRGAINEYLSEKETSQNQTALIEIFSFENTQNIASEVIDQVKVKIADISLDQDAENTDNITDQNNLQNENNFIKNIQSTSTDFNLLINQNLDSQTADRMLETVIEYFVNEIMLERLITEIISFSIFIEQKKVLLDNF